MKEVEIIKRIKQGDTNAFALLYDLHWKKVYNFSKLYIYNSNEIMDIVQEVFVRIWENRNLLDEYKNLNGFIFIATRNVIINNTRKYFNEINYRNAACCTMEESYNLEEVLEADNLKEYIDELVTLLPPRQKEVFYMSRRDYLTHREIAAQCDISEKAVERHIYLALKFIKKNMPLY